MLTPDQAQPLIDALRPLLQRVRRDATAVKKPNGEMAWTRTALTTPLMQRHLNSGPPRGVAQIRAGESVTMVGAFDLDSHGGETSWEEMVEVAAQLASVAEDRGLLATAFRSTGGRGIHLYFLFDAPQDAYSLRRALESVLAVCGYVNNAKGVSRGGVEVFPKQDEVPIDGFGNQMILPLAGKSTGLDLLLGMSIEPHEIEWRMSAPVQVLERPVVKPSAPVGEANVASIRTALAAIPNESRDDLDYESWWKIIASIHHATNGGPEGLELAEEFSQRNEAYQDDPTHLSKRVWPYIKSERTGRVHTVNHLKGVAREQGWEEAHELSFTEVDTGAAPQVENTYKAQPLVLADDVFEETEEQKKLARYDAMNVFKKRISETGDEYQLREVVAPAVRDNMLLGEIERETLAQVLCDQLRGLGTKVTISQARKLLAPARQKKTPSDNLPEWAKGWVYVTTKDQFFRFDSEEWLTQQGFRAKHNRVSFVDEEGRADASRDALDNLMIPVVTRGLYLPWADTHVFEHDGVMCVNTYRPSSTPAAVDKLGPKGQTAVDLLVGHVNMMCGGRPDVRDTILDWMAFNVQNPGVKIRWSPLIKGIPGDGKSLIGSALEAMMGPSNVSTVGPAALASNFTGWAQGSCVALLEEVRIVGHNRYDVFNTLKPYVTNSRVPCHPKGQDEFTIINVTNYIGFTNYNDAMPIDETDRRWMIIFSPFTNIGDLALAIGTDPGAYFERLFRAINDQRASLRRWFLDRKLSETFKPDGRAPLTAERDSMIGLALSDEESGIAEVLTNGAPGIAPRVLATSYVNTALQLAGLDVNLQTSALSKMLTKAGWTKYPKRVKWCGKAEWIWLKGAMPKSHLELVLELDKTLGTGSEDIFSGFSDCEDLFN